MRETRLLGYGVASRQTRQPGFSSDGSPILDDKGNPAIIDVLELVLINQQDGQLYILPLTEEGVQVIEKALRPSSLVIPPAGMKL